MESPEGDSGRCGGMRVMSTDAEVDAGNKQLRTHRVTSGSSTPLKIDRSLLLKVLEEIAVHYLRRIADKTDGINHVFGVEDYHAFLINLRKKKMVRWVSGAVKESLTPRGTHDSAPVCTGNKQFVAAKKYYRGHTVTPNDLEKKLSSPIEVFAREAYRRGVPDRKAFLMKLHDNGFCEVAMFVYDGAEFGLRREGRVEWVPMKDIQERQHVIKSEIKNEDRQEEDEDDFIDVGGEGDNGGRLSGGSSAVTGCPSPHSEAEV